jgi:hypothetical protein
VLTRPPSRGHDVAPAQLGEDEVGQRQGGRCRQVRHAALGADFVEALLPGGEAALVGVDRVQVGRVVDAVAGLAIDESYVALKRWVELVGRERPCSPFSMSMLHENSYHLESIQLLKLLDL